VPPSTPRKRKRVTARAIWAVRAAERLRDGHAAVVANMFIIRDVDLGRGDGRTGDGARFSSSHNR
jgi:hypothetical protein